MPTQEELTNPEERRAAALAAAAGALRAWVEAQHSETASSKLSSKGISAPPARKPAAPAAPAVVRPESRTDAARPAPAARPARSTSILSLDTAESDTTESAGEAEPPRPSRLARLGQALTLVGRAIAPLGGPIRTMAPGLLKVVLGLTLVAAVALSLIGAGRWAYRTYGPQAFAAWDNLTAPTGTVVLESVPPGSQVFINGSVVGTTPMTTELAPGRHLVEFRRGETIRSLEVNVSADRSTVARFDWTAARTGTLRVDSTPAGATVIVDGRERGVTPITLGDLTVGQHELVLRSEAGTVRRTVMIRLDSPTEVTEALFSGWMHVSTPIEIEISQDGRRLPLDEQNRVMLPPGAHRVQFQNRSLGYLETRQIQVRPGEITRVVIAPSPSTLTVSANTAAEVLIDGEHAGYTPLTNFPIRLGTRDIVVRASSGTERRFTLTVSATPVQLNVDF